MSVENIKEEWKTSKGNGGYFKVTKEILEQFRASNGNGDRIPGTGKDDEKQWRTFKGNKSHLQAIEDNEWNYFRCI